MMYDFSDLSARSRLAKAGLHRALQLLGRILADLKAQEVLSLEEKLMLSDMIGVLASCEGLIRRLRALKREEAEHRRV
jgi:hypothetical protein